MDGIDELEFNKEEFELDMLTVCHMFKMPYEQAVAGARKELKEIRDEEREIAKAKNQQVQESVCPI